MTSIEAVPQPRIDVLVSAVDGSGRQLRHTEYRGTVWYGGHPQVNPRISPVRKPIVAGISTPFWIPDSLGYRDAGHEDAVVTASIGLQSIQESAQVQEVSADLVQHPGRGGLHYALLSLQASAVLPLGLSYQVVVIVDADRVAG